MRHAVYVVAFVLMSFAAGNARDASPLTDSQIRAHLMAASVENYTGNCPCPDNLDRAGRRCGERSAYSRPGGAAPLCYSKDVTPEMIAEFREGAQR